METHGGGEEGDGCRFLVSFFFFPFVLFWNDGGGLVVGMTLCKKQRKLITGGEDRSPTNPEVVAVKRVLALENDIVRTKAPYPFPTETVPQGHIWVEGEHPESDRWSNDSNHYGPVCFHLLPSLYIFCALGEVWDGEREG